MQRNRSDRPGPARPGPLVERCQGKPDTREIRQTPLPGGPCETARPSEPAWRGRRFSRENLRVVITVRARTKYVDVETNIKNFKKIEVNVLQNLYIHLYFGDACTPPPLRRAPRGQSARESERALRRRSLRRLSHVCTIAHTHAPTHKNRFNTTGDALADFYRLPDGRTARDQSFDLSLPLAPNAGILNLKPPSSAPLPHLGSSAGRWPARAQVLGLRAGARTSER